MQRSAVVVLAVCLVVFVSSVALFGARTDDPLGIAVSPHTLIIGADQGSISVHTAIPLSAVDTSTLQLNGVPVWWTKADARGELVAKFHEADVKAIVAPPTTVLTLTGEMKDGSPFAGSDEVRVILAK